MGKHTYQDITHCMATLKCAVGELDEKCLCVMAAERSRKAKQAGRPLQGGNCVHDRGRQLSGVRVPDHMGRPSNAPQDCGIRGNRPTYGL